MISIKNTNHKNASDAFYRKIEVEVSKRLSKNQRAFRGYKIKDGDQLFDYFRDNIKDFLKGDRQKITNIIDQVDHIFKPLRLKRVIPLRLVRLKRALKNIFFFEAYGRWQPYNVLMELNINSCPYCNRSYITTIGTDNKKFHRADMDHFMCKEKYPYLRLSFYNLIPSCTICNQRAKGAKETSFDKNIYPYEEEFGNFAKFKHVPKNIKQLLNGGDILIEVKLNTPAHIKQKIDNNIKLFKLVEQYKMHKKELQFILEKSFRLNENYLSFLEKNLKLFNSKEEAYEFAFGKPIDDKKHINVPLSKFTKDISEDIGIL
jgi:hypothetical protein